MTLNALQYALDPSLVEDSVLLARRGDPLHAFWRQREAIYEVTDPGEQDRQFAGLAARECESLQLAAPLEQALREQPIVPGSVSQIRVLRAKGPRQEGAELFVSRTGQEPARALLLRLTPATFADPTRGLVLLRHELQHIADMVDPAFGYDPAPVFLRDEPERSSLILERFRVIWDTTIDGRLTRRGHAAPGARELRQREHHGLFGFLGPLADRELERWFEEDHPTFDLILGAALAPGGASQASTSGPGRPGFCAICRCPAPRTALPSTPLASRVEEEVRLDFPDWRPEHGLCPQCFELYAARPLSRAELARLAKL